MGRKAKAELAPFSIPGGELEIEVGEKKAQKQELVREAWREGELSWKLHSAQLDLYAFSESLPPNSMGVRVCARRLGKTFEEITETEEFARKNAGSIQLFAAPTKGAAADIVLPNWRTILSDCPDEWKPKYKQGTGVWEWPNGSVLKLRGTDLEADRLRGASADRIRVDEAGFHKNLKRVVDDILFPQTDTTGGKLTMSTTPPDSMEHEFREFWDAARLSGALITKTVFDNPLLSSKTLMRICKRANRGYMPAQVDEILKARLDVEDGDASPTWLREYLCRMVTDRSLRVTPEFNPRTHVLHIKDPPTYFQPYVFLDLAFVRDYTHALFAIHDFTAGRLLIVDEWRGRRMSSGEVWQNLVQRERHLFAKRVPLRYADNSNQQQLFDLQTMHGYTVIPTRKSEKETMVNPLRELIGAGKIIVDPRCQFLISQLEHGIWKVSDSKKVDFERNEEMGHLDGVDALIYGIRNVNWSHNPTPLGSVNTSTHFVLPGTVPSGQSEVVVELKKLVRGVYGR